MNVEQLIAELRLHPPETPVVAPAFDHGYTDQVVVEPVQIRTLQPPLVGMSHCGPDDPGAAGPILQALSIGPPASL